MVWNYGSRGMSRQLNNQQFNSDTKFEQDLETAQALSLEAFALEKFKNELEKQKISHCSSSQPNFESQSSERFYTVPKLRPPPVLRKTSVQPNSVAGVDLISFNSPVGKNKPNQDEFDVLRDIPLGTSSYSVNKIDTVTRSTVSTRLSFTEINPKPDQTDTPNLPGMSRFEYSNLIDFSVADSNPPKENFVRVSVLEAFDPLLNSVMAQNSSPLSVLEESSSENSIYVPYDPFEFLYSPSSRASQNSDPVYSAVVKAPKLTVPHKSANSSTDSPNKVTPTKYSDKNNRLYENVTMKKSLESSNPDLYAFYLSTKELRESFKYTDVYTNPGLVYSATLENSSNGGISIKLVIYSDQIEFPILFTCDVNASIEHVLMHAVCGAELGEVKDFMLKVHLLEEYFESHKCLADYEYVNQCMKLDQDVILDLVEMGKIPRTLARTEEDDIRVQKLSCDEMVTSGILKPVSYENTSILLETLENEMERLEKTVRQVEMRQTGNFNLKPQSVLQAVKAVCCFLGQFETVAITDALEHLVHTCDTLSKTHVDTKSKFEIVSEQDDYSIVKLKPSVVYDLIRNKLNQVRSVVQDLLEMYSKVHSVQYFVAPPVRGPGFKRSCDILDNVLLHVSCLYRVPSKWNFDNYVVATAVYYGTRHIGTTALSDKAHLQQEHSRVFFNTWLQFEDVTISQLPREARIIVVVYGSKVTDDQLENVELGWAALQFFDFNGDFAQGKYLLSLWPPSANKRLGPAPSLGRHPSVNSFPVVGIELFEYGIDVKFPHIELTEPTIEQDNYDFNSLDHNTQQLLNAIMEQDTFTNPVIEDREVLWEKRFYLRNRAEALPKILLAAHSWDYPSLMELYPLLKSWTPMEPVNALQLLLPCFPDSQVRSLAVSWIEKLDSDQMIDYLPQLVQAIKCETYESSALVQMLLSRSLESIRFAHHFFWLLIQSLPNHNFQPDGTFLDETDDVPASESRYHMRLQMVLKAFLNIQGRSMQDRFQSQQRLVAELSRVAESVKTSKESSRLNVLMQNLNELDRNLSIRPGSLPLGPSLQVNGVEVRTSSYFPSNTLPLKINFKNQAGTIIPAIFKVGDDLRQDMLSLQMIRVMEKLWLKEGIDLKMVTFTCVPTGSKEGMIELVPGSETLRKIQVEFGLTGSFKDRPIAEWLAKHNPSTLDYDCAVANFTASCAGYSVATYILGICDRHNDNIMLKTSGHLFHIDFGKFLGDAQMIGNFKRDRTPFVLTSDMAYVINGGDKPSARFHHFVDLCCQAFNIVRKHGNTILNLFGHMASSGTGGLTVEAVRYVQTALLPDLSNAEAAATFARMIDSSLNSWFTQFNFFLHNLAQLRFTGDHNDGQLLSFVSKTYTMKQEGRLTQVGVFGYQKRYAPEKYYVFILKVERENQKDPTFLYRTYKEFQEFHQKLCMLFPLAKGQSNLQNLGIHVGRSNIKQVAEKRMLDIQMFLTSLFSMADEICHSDLVYTFFHPLHRDQLETNNLTTKSKERKHVKSDSYIIRGCIKLSLVYSRETFRVMVHHIKDLNKLSNGQEPSTYVKVYLQPDPAKVTKRKTKVVRRNNHPSFMEMLEYRMPIEIVQSRKLQATVWNHDPLQENEFLGGITIDLSEFDLTEETESWYALGNIQNLMV